ncbi:MAG: 3'(2'),5'-bisphosphate nucleotidase CysQ [Gallionella sp.]|nr:3'(2'),5'-bisphosphate nucleotidase CysQ [Gallionella sp.]
MPMQPILEVVEIAKQAGKAILQIYAQPALAASHKADLSPLTAADLASHHIICERLAQLTPSYPVLSEESAEISVAQRMAWTRYWLVDPLDGTKEFIKRNGEFTVNIALIENGKPILGVVYAPVLDVCYYAERGEGAFVTRGSGMAQPIQVKSLLAGEPIKVVASRSHSDARTASLLHRLGNCETISMGSSLKLCLVAEGVAHFYPRLGPTMEWDTAAAHAIVNEAGGTVCNSAAIELPYNKPDMHNSEFFVYAKSEETFKQATKELQ